MTNSPPNPQHPFSPGLQTHEFRCIGRNGLQDPCNSYPHAMAWFANRLFVGTTRCVLTFIHYRSEDLRGWSRFPVRPPKGNPYAVHDSRSQIWSFDPLTDQWTQVLASPLMPEQKGVRVPAYHGVRNMTVFRGRGDQNPALFVTTWSPRGGPGALLLRTEDGVHFDSLPIRGFEDGRYSSFRSLCEFNGTLYTAPSSTAGSRNAAGVVEVLACSDPVREAWQSVNNGSFGDPYNESVSDLAAFHGQLYAGTRNPNTGFQLWRTDAAGSPPYTWKRVLADGAGRGNLNETIGSMCVFNNALYIGSTISNGGYDRENGIGPAPFELIRVHPDDSWDLLVGDGRNTTAGVKVPLSGYGPGFDKFFNTYLWRMCVHDGWLYVGTFATSSFLPFLPRERWPAAKRELVEAQMSFILERSGGFDLWRSRDGVQWTPVTRNGFGNPFNYGVRTLASSPHGLFVGAANPFAPEVGLARAAGWRYEPNPRGGMEIWFGSHTRPTPPTQPAPAPVALPPPTPEGFLQSLVDEFFEQSGFRSLGYWTPRIHSTRAACENLLDEVLAFFPEKRGRLLVLLPESAAEVAYLAAHWPNADLTVLCRNDALQQQIQALVPSCRVRRDRRPLPADLRAQFSAVINVESLGRAPDALEWISEAQALLEPGGTFTVALPFPHVESSPWLKQARRTGRTDLAIPLRQTFEAAGFPNPTVLDVTAPCWQGFWRRVHVFLHDKMLDHELDKERAAELKTLLYGGGRLVYAYYFVSGNKGKPPPPGASS